MILYILVEIFCPASIVDCSIIEFATLLRQGDWCPVSLYLYVRPVLIVMCVTERSIASNVLSNYNIVDVDRRVRVASPEVDDSDILQLVFNCRKVKSSLVHASWEDGFVAPMPLDPFIVVKVDDQVAHCLIEKSIHLNVNT